MYFSYPLKSALLLGSLLNNTLYSMAYGDVHIVYKGYCMANKSSNLKALLSFYRLH